MLNPLISLPITCIYTNLTTIKSVIAWIDEQGKAIVRDHSKLPDRDLIKLLIIHQELADDRMYQTSPMKQNKKTNLMSLYKVSGAYIPVITFLCSIRNNQAEN